MNITLFICLLFALQIFYWFVGRRFSQKTTSQKDYFLAEKAVKLFPLTMTFLATQVGGGFILGAAEEAYQFGWMVLFYPLGAALGFVALGSGVGRKLASLPISTVAEIFEVAYGSVIMKKIASTLSVISLFMILVAQIVASSKFLFSTGLMSTPLFILFWAVVIVYTARGGLKAVIATDVAQAAFFSVAFLACFTVAFFGNSEAPLSQIVQSENMALVFPKLSGWLFMPLLFMLIEQDMGQRCFAGASSFVVSKAALLAGVGTLIICAIPIFFGLLAKTQGIEIPQGSSVLMAVVAKVTSPAMAAIVGCGVLAAIISTATSLINAISSNLANDFIKPSLSLTNSRGRTQGITCLVSSLAIFTAFYFDNVVDMLIQSYELSVVSLFVPIVIALFKKKKNLLSAALSLSFGALGFVFFRIYPMPFPKEILGVLLSLFGYGCGEVFALYQSRLVSRKNAHKQM